MRRIVLMVPGEIAAHELEAELSRWSRGPIVARSAHVGDGPGHVLTVHVANRDADRVVETAAQYRGARVSFDPRGALVLDPRGGEEGILGRSDGTSFRSPLEILLDGLQSTGSWRGYLTYSACSAVIAWIGLYTDAWFLMTAAMLVAPYAEPAMNAALGTARGSPGLVFRSVARYAVGMLVAVLVPAAMAWSLDLLVPTRLMAETATVSHLAVLLPVVAGAAGALNLAQPARSSLVSGAAPGALVAASLAPAAAVVGSSLVLGDGALGAAGAYLLGLQLVAIHVSAGMVFRLCGVRPRAGNRTWSRAAFATAVTVLVGALALEVQSAPLLGRRSVAARAEQEVVQAFRSRDDVVLIELESRFSRTAGADVLVVTGLFAPAAEADPDALREELIEGLSAALAGEGLRVVFRFDAVTGPG